MKKISLVMQIGLYLLLSLLTLSSIAVASAAKPNKLDALTGTLEIRVPLVQKHKVSAKENIQYILKVSPEKIYTLHIKGSIPPQLRTGMQVKILEAAIDEAQDNDAVLEVSATDLIIDTDHSPVVDVETIGRLPTLVMLVNFTDQADEKPWSTDFIKKMVFTRTNFMLLEYSYQQTTLRGEVMDWITIPLSRNEGSCQAFTNQLPILTNAALEKAGVNVANYNHLIYIFPKNPNCTWDALATLGGKPSITWLNGNTDEVIIAHELGHNFGLYHSHGSGKKDHFETEDPADVMSENNILSHAHFNAYQKERIGWLNRASSPLIENITRSGTYTIYPYVTPLANTKALKILKSEVNGASDYYYLEIRHALGFDLDLVNCLDCQLTQGVLLHVGNSSNGDSSRFLDIILPGESFKDPDAAHGGITINVKSASFAGAEIEVLIGDAPLPPPPPPPPPPPSCEHEAPTLSINPWTSRRIVAGKNTNYIVSLHNNDSNLCDTSTFNLAAIVAEKSIHTSFTADSVQLKPNETVSVELEVHTTKATPKDFYNIEVTATNHDAASAKSSVNASLAVEK